MLHNKKYLSVPVHLCIVFLSIIFIVTAFTGCATYTSGRCYTLSKVNRDTTLIEADKEIPPQNSANDINYDSIIGKGKTIAIKLNGGYIRYLQYIACPEVAIFVKAKIQTRGDKATLENPLVWEKVYMSSEKGNTYITMNKDSSLPRKDITILPPVKYNGEDSLLKFMPANACVFKLDQNKSLICS